MQLNNSQLSPMSAASQVKCTIDRFDEVQVPQITKKKLDVISEHLIDLSYTLFNRF